MFLVFVSWIDALHVAVTLILLLVVAVALWVVRLSAVQVLHLRVVGRKRLVEYANILVVAQRHTIGIEKSSSAFLVPHKIVFPKHWVAHHKLSGEHSLCKENNSTIILDNSLVLFPKRLKRDYVVPLRVLVVLV